MSRSLRAEDQAEGASILAELERLAAARWGEQAVPAGWVAVCAECGGTGRPVLAVRFGAMDVCEVLDAITGRWLLVGTEVSLLPETWQDGRTGRKRA